METIKVNMSPNPLDVQTIHASKNDGEARQWEFELHNNGDVIDASEISDQLVFKAYKGGTEQILPENGSVPTTSPILADIVYPDIRRDNQYFTYRESPTPVDGLAKIKSIKGNTLKWNQLVQNGNFESTSNWTTFNGTVNKTVSNNVMTMAISSSAFSVAQYAVMISTGHKIFFHMEARASENDKVVTNWRNRLVGTDWTIDEYIGTENNTACLMGLHNKSDTDATGVTAYLRNCMVIDLTAMFGQGNEPTTVEEFTSLFPLSYYSYNQGSLLSFNGNGIKTVGKNLVNPNDFVQGLIDWQSGNVVANPSWITSPFISVLDATSVTVQGWKDGAEENFMVRFAEYDSSYNVVQNTNNINISAVAHYQRKVTLNANTKYIRFSCGFNNRATTPQTFFAVNRVMLEFGGTASDYESYQEDVLSLPTQQYFPTGMKSAGSVYDELTESKAVTRIGAVDLGSLTWTYANNCFAGTLPSNSYRFASDVGATSIYQFVGTVPNGTADMGNKANKTFALFYNSTNTTPRVIYVKDSSYTDATVFKTNMNGVYLYYELATETETSFTTASLVTENAEIPLSNEDGTLIGKCTEQLSENPGFIDAKIKLADADGECYSNKIQLHVERSPQ